MISFSTRSQPLTDADAVCGLGPTRCDVCRHTTEYYLAEQHAAVTFAGRSIPTSWRSCWYVACGECGHAVEVHETTAEALRSRTRA